MKINCRGDSVTQGDARAAGEDHLAVSASTKKQQKGGTGRVKRPNCF